MKNPNAPTQAVVTQKRLSHATLQRLGATTLVSVVMGVNLKNAVVEIYRKLNLGLFYGRSDGR